MVIKLLSDIENIILDLEDHNRQNNIPTKREDIVKSIKEKSLNTIIIFIKQILSNLKEQTISDNEIINLLDSIDYNIYSFKKCIKREELLLQTLNIKNSMQLSLALVNKEEVYINIFRFLVKHLNLLFKELGF